MTVFTAWTLRNSDGRRRNSVAFTFRQQLKETKIKKLAVFQAIGRVGTVRQFENVTRIAVAASYRRKDANGKWINEADWNEVTIFS